MSDIQVNAIAAHYLHNPGDPPSPAILQKVAEGTWTEGGMAEAGWFLSGTDKNGAPIFTRRYQMTYTLEDTP